MIAPEKLLEAAKALEPQLQEWRRTLHRHPEVGFDLPQTKALVQKALTEMGYAPQDCGKCGVLALAGGKKPGKVILLRGDMDALPLQEESGEEFASELPGKMHGCGHDMHTAMMLGAAQLLKEHEDEIADSVEIIKGLIDYASKFEREPISVSKLVIGMKCGGSDGLSGITANPLVGRFSDLLISKGGTTILTEVPEMFGAETILMNRCANEELFHQTVDLINDFKNYFKSHNQTIYENPSPGNKKGGISTLEDKSLGCTQKSGSALVKGVLQYGDTVKTPGLNLLSAPGNDLVAATALAAAGAHIVLFTTGRGTPFASPVPTMKIATNSRLAGKKSNWIDFNAGVLVEDKTMEEETKALFDLVVETASGRQVCSEAAGFHDMAIFKQGVTL